MIGLCGCIRRRLKGLNVVHCNRGEVRLDLEVRISKNGREIVREPLAIGEERRLRVMGLATSWGAVSVQAQPLAGP